MSSEDKPGNSKDHLKAAGDAVKEAAQQLKDGLVIGAREVANSVGQGVRHAKVGFHKKVAEGAQNVITDADAACKSAHDQATVDARDAREKADRDALEIKAKADQDARETKAKADQDD